MNDADFRQQQELEEERLRLDLDALTEIDRAGMHQVAEFLALELGLSEQFNQEKCNA